MLYDWVCEGTMGAKMDCDFERLDLSTRPFLDKSMVCHCSTSEKGVASWMLRMDAK
jgi:hypothetical protein